MCGFFFCVTTSRAASRLQTLRGKIAYRKMYGNGWVCGDSRRSDKAVGFGACPLTTPARLYKHQKDQGEVVNE